MVGFFFWGGVGGSNGCFYSPLSPRSTQFTSGVRCRVGPRISTCWWLSSRPAPARASPPRRGAPPGRSHCPPFSRTPPRCRSPSLAPPALLPAEPSRPTPTAPSPGEHLGAGCWVGPPRTPPHYMRQAKIFSLTPPHSGTGPRFPPTVTPRMHQPPLGMVARASSLSPHPREATGCRVRRARKRGARRPPAPPRACRGPRQ